MSAVTQGEIKVKAAVPIGDLKELEMEIVKNSHASIRLTGMVPEELGDGFLLRPMERGRIEVWAGETMLFNGIPETIRVTQEGSGYNVTVEGVSASRLLDYGKKNRTFQKTDATYGEVVREVLADRGAEPSDSAAVHAAAVFTAEDRKTGGVLYQIGETDWEFLCRLAGHLGTAVLPSVLSSGMGIYVGFPMGRVWDGSGADMVREKVFLDRENRCLCQEIAAYENWNIGDRVKWMGREYAVIRKGCRLERGLLRFRYVISGAEAFSGQERGAGKGAFRHGPCAESGGCLLVSVASGCGQPDVLHAGKRGKGVYPFGRLRRKTGAGSLRGTRERCGKSGNEMQRQIFHDGGAETDVPAAGQYGVP